MKNPTVLTVILNYRTPELTIKATAAAVREMHGICGEIVVVDNGSGDDSCELISRAIELNGWGQGGRVTLKQTGRNGGYGAGNNFALATGLASGEMPDYFYILNSDAWPEKGAIHALLKVMHQNRKAGIAGSAIRGVNGEPHCTAFRFPSVAGEFEGAARTGFITRALADSVVPLPIPNTTTQVDWVAGASAMMRRKMIEQIGLFDETFFLYFEETDLCRRAAQAGWSTLYVPASDVVHVGSVSTGMKTWSRTPQYWFDSRLNYFSKNHGRRYAVMATIARVFGSVIWRVRFVLSSRPLGDPPHFLRDLIAHSFKTLFRRSARPTANPISQPLTEDVK